MADALSACLISARPCVGATAKCSQILVASYMRTSSSTARQIRPQLAALSAGKSCASRARPRARASPTRRGRNQVPPESGISPTRAKDWMNFALRLAITMSQASAMLQPAPAATPLTAATTGKGRFRSLSHERIVVCLLRATEHDGLVQLGKPIAQILARAEATTRAGDQQGTATFVGFGIIDRLSQSMMHRVVESVELVGPVESNDAISGTRLDENGRIGCHDLLRNRSSAPISLLSFSKSSAIRS